MGLLKNVVVGWENVEPVLLGCISCELSIMLRGKHGAGKTAVAKIIAEALSNQHRHYNATIADLLTIAGIFNPKALSDMENPRIEYAKHAQTVWDADYLSIDELTRAPKESQNLWMSILEEKTLQGNKLKYKTAVATMNPSTYAATNRLDAALFDRFYAVIDIPDIIRSKNNRKNIINMLKLTRYDKAKRDPKDVKRLGIAIQNIKELYNNFIQNDTLQEAIDDYIADFLVELVNSTEIYISARKIDQIRACIFATTAYFKSIENLGYKINAPQGLFAHGAQFAVTHVFGTALSIPIKTIMTCHTKATKRLKGLSGSFSDKIRQKICDVNTVTSKINILEKYFKEISTFPPAEMYATINSAFQEAVQADFADEQSDKVKLLETLATAVDKMQPFLAKMNASKNPLAKGTAKTISGELIAALVKGVNSYMQKNQFLSKNLENQHDNFITKKCNYNKVARKGIDSELQTLFKEGLDKRSATELVKAVITCFNKTITQIENNSDIIF